MPTIPTRFPDVIRAGDTLKFTRSLSDYEPDDGWTLSYALTNADNTISFSATNSSNTHLVNVDSVTTNGWTAGTYQWVGYVESSDSPTERYTVESGTVEIKTDLSDAAFDGRSHVKKTLDLIEAEIEARVSGSTESYSIAGRSLSKTPMEQLIEMRSKYRAWYREEVAAERIARGLGTKRKIRVRFM